MCSRLMGCSRLSVCWSLIPCAKVVDFMGDGAWLRCFPTVCTPAAWLTAVLHSDLVPQPCLPASSLARCLHLLQLSSDSLECTDRAASSIMLRYCRLGRHWRASALQSRTSCWSGPCGDILPLAPVTSLLPDPCLSRLVPMTNSHIPLALCRATTQAHATGHEGLFRLRDCPFTSSQVTQLW